MLVFPEEFAQDPAYVVSVDRGTRILFGHNQAKSWITDLVTQIVDRQEMPGNSLPEIKNG